MSALGPPDDLRDNPPNDRVYHFMTRTTENTEPET
jgi:phospholipid/cholesterol/gamma-HCH transport system ATP-binding protein